MEFKIGNKVVGRIEDDAYITERRPEHFFRIFQGFGISSTVLYELIRFSIKEIRILYVGKRGTKIYTSTVKEYLNGITYNDPENPRDKQYVIPVTQMKEE